MIKVYILDVVDLFSEEVQKEYIALFPDDGAWKKRITSINDYVFIKDKALSIGVGLLLLYFLLKNGISPSELRLPQNGKLYVKQNLFFNISHTDRYVTFSVGESENEAAIEYLDSNIVYSMESQAINSNIRSQIDDQSIKVTSLENIISLVMFADINALLII